MIYIVELTASRQLGPYKIFIVHKRNETSQGTSQQKEIFDFKVKL